jgi:putative protease
MTKILALGGTIPRGVVSYGYLPLMHVRNCPVRAASGCGACNGKGELTDRRHVVFAVECDEQRSTTLLNSVPLDLADRPLAGLDFQLLYFTRESTEEAAAIAERYRTAQKTDQPHTGGLYYRTLL